MTEKTTGEGDWNRTDWVGEGQEDAEEQPTDVLGRDPADATAGARWNKQEYVGDRGEGSPPPQDPDTMPEGETGLSGDRHTPGEQHFARGQATDPDA